MMCRRQAGTCSPRLGRGDFFVRGGGSPAKQVDKNVKVV